MSVNTVYMPQAVVDFVNDIVINGRSLFDETDCLFLRTDTASCKVYCYWNNSDENKINMIKLYEKFKEKYETQEIKLTDDPQVPVFPNDYFEFGNGAKILDREVDKWVKRGIEYLKDKDAGDHYTTSCGDTHVAIYKYMYDEDKENSYQYEVVVSKNYHSATIIENEVCKFY